MSSGLALLHPQPSYDMEDGFEDSYQLGDLESHLYDHSQLPSTSPPELDLSLTEEAPASKGVVHRKQWLEPEIQHVPRVSATKLPTEILLLILRHNMSPLHELDISLSQGPRSLWLAESRTRKAHCLVCKSWSNPATRVLYEQIVIRRMGQIPALAQTLASVPELSTFIREIHLKSLLVWRGFTEVVREDLAFIIQRSAALRRFVYDQRLSAFPVAEDLSDERDLEVVCPAFFHPSAPGIILGERIAGGLRELELIMLLTESALQHLHLMLLDASSLVSLTLGAPANFGRSYHDLYQLGPLHLPALESLQVERCIHHPSFLKYISELWNMPRLKSLSVLYCFAIPAGLLEKHGASLTYLNIHPAVTGTTDDSPGSMHFHSDDLERLTGWCPNLAHLAVPIHSPNDISSHPGLRLPALRHLDVWLLLVRSDFRTLRQVSEEAGRLRAELKPKVDDGRFQSLKTVRILDCGHYDHHELPWVCHPSMVDAGRVPWVCHPSMMVDAGRVRVVHWHGIAYFQTVQCVLPTDGEVLSGRLLRFSGLGDAEWAPRTQEDDDDGTSWVSDDASQYSELEEEDIYAIYNGEGGVELADRPNNGDGRDSDAGSEEGIHEEDDDGDEEEDQSAYYEDEEASGGEGDEGNDEGDEQSADEDEDASGGEEDEDVEGEGEAREEDDEDRDSSESEESDEQRVEQLDRETILEMFRRSQECYYILAEPELGQDAEGVEVPRSPQPYHI
ncbi:hypothetical protein C8Q74DRAFT_453877 [Fomes fomentarius]|nr:hypothetical protein C8Q74DRAFT_453877 [Fomes fomentarius]